MTAAASPLDGIRVVDLTTFLSGPIAAMALLQLGAEVIKVEPPSGDVTRGGADAPLSPFYWALHRGRRSAALDLKSAAGRDVLLELVATADVLIENFRPGVMARLDLDWPTLQATNPRLIVGSITGYGANSPMAEAPAIDGVVQAFSGSFGLPQVYGMPAAPVPMTIADLAAGSITAQGILASLYTRERTGVGARIEIALIDALMPWLCASDWVGSLRYPGTVVATGSDGLDFVVQTPSHFRARLSTLVGVEFEPTDAYGRAVRAVLATRTRQEWLTVLADEGIPAAPVHTLDEALAHPATATVEVDGRVLADSPFVIDGQRRSTAVAPPRLGEHTELVLREVLGYDDHKIATCRASGAFG
jgi:crotonobetainyl-CoA:carnitine CoA-transferase CaiB-like acyl-CoA transferase